MRVKTVNGKSRRIPLRQRGVMLLEALVAILLFSMGILALVALQAVAIKNTADAKYRADAAFLANQIIARMWMENPANLATYAHYPTKDGACSFSGSASSNANVTTWLGDVSSGGTVAATLPGADADSGAVPGIDDGVRLHVLRHGEGEDQIRQFRRGRRPLRHDL